MENIKTYGASGAWGWPLVVSCYTPEIMSYNQAGSFPLKWISPYRWENLFNLFDPPEAASGVIPRQSVEGIVVSGWISGNGTGVIDPIFRLSGVQLSPTSSGNYSLVLKDGTGTTLFTSSFEARFVGIEGEEQDPYYFTVVLPYASSASSVSLWNGTILLDQIAATSYAPQVQVISPNGGETAGTLFTIAWTAYDPDADPLTFIVFYSGDDGLTWTPVSPRITETYYTVDASRLPGGTQSLIRVVASDEFHTSSDESDGPFSVPQKSPLDVMADCVGLSEEGTINLGQTIILKSRGFDPEDGRLNDSAFMWTSTLNGALGAGKTLAIASLRPGVHNITLIAADSHGNNSTHSFEVTVVHHDVTVTSINPEKTVIGAGYDLALNVTLRNQGLSPENVSLTLIFYEIDASFVHVELYGSSTSGWGTDQTRLTRPGPTIRVRQWDAIQLTLHSVDKFLCDFFVDYNGDGAPTEGEPRSPDFISTVEYRFVADTPGTFVYYCSYHSSVMFGTFVVDEPDILSYYQDRVPNEEILGSAQQEYSLRQHANFTNGYYAIGVFAGPVFNEVKILDNVQTEGLIIVTVPGDVEGDRDVDIFDIVRMAGVYGLTKPNPSYHPNCDIDGDGDIDIFDIVIAAGHYGDSW
jgi:hypothetical protein